MDEIVRTACGSGRLTCGRQHHDGDSVNRPLPQAVLTDMLIDSFMPKFDASEIHQMID